MNRTKQLIIVVLSGSGLFIYLFLIIKLCIMVKCDNEKQLSDFSTTTLLALSALFSTNLGAFLGITITTDTNKITEYFKIKNYSEEKITLTQGAQLVACIIYILSLLTLTIRWLEHDFRTNCAPEVAQSLVSTFIGITLGALSISLSIQKGSNGKP